MMNTITIIIGHAKHIRIKIKQKPAKVSLPFPRAQVPSLASLALFSPHPPYGNRKNRILLIKNVPYTNKSRYQTIFHNSDPWFHL